ncbi:MAG: hypothetical protein M8364_03675 [Methylobacter sp.]|uniref:hypothetical protein n=1 Tax=Methylobacter sp. TaxID=2051955 RepID=UPI00258848F3|nr:hypothetical protein [Methylobacter sp.]MCL7419984.1 hypothetical protein [Methylobacter sp.]
MDIDFASLFAGISLTALAGWFGSFIAFRKDERAVYIKQITEERTKWRSEMRNLTQDVVELYSNESETPKAEKIQRLRAKLQTSTNPKCKYDKKILEVYDQLKHKANCEEFTKLMSLLLKHDWERVKWECMPLYLKLILRYTKKQREWRDPNFRPASIDIQG